MSRSLIEKLSTFVRLSDDDTALIERVTEHRRRVKPRDEIVGEKRNAGSIIVAESGWGCRYRVMEDGRRQIVGFVLPGDVYDFNVFILGKVEYGFSALTTMDVAEISPAGFDLLMAGHMRVRQAIWWAQLVALEIQREWTVSLGQRTALERIAHLLCELFYRLRSVGLTMADRCPFPVTQTELAEASGLSTVHVNRTLQELRALQLIELHDRILRIPDLAALELAGLFDPGYLHLDHAGRHLDAN